MTILFDLDGTLVDVSNSYRKAIVLTVEQFSGQRVSPDEVVVLKEGGGCNNDWDLSARLLSQRGVNVPFERIVEVFQGFYWGLGDEPDGLIHQENWLISREILRDLSQRYPLGIVTGRPHREAVWTLKKFACEEYFQTLVSHEDCPPGQGKPDPFGLKLAMSRLSEESGVYIGDTTDDRLAARALGLRFIGVVPPKGAYPGCFKDGQDLVLDNINRIREVF